MTQLINQRWCRENRVQMTVECLDCRKELRNRRLADPENWRSDRGQVNHEGQEITDDHRIMAQLSTWVAGDGLSAYLYEYICPRNHRTYAAMPEKNTGKHISQGGSADTNYHKPAALTTKGYVHGR